MTSMMNILAKKANQTPSNVYLIGKTLDQKRLITSLEFGCDFLIPTNVEIGGGSPPTIIIRNKA